MLPTPVIKAVFPIVNPEASIKPLIEEALAAGIKQLIFVTEDADWVIEEYPDAIYLRRTLSYGLGGAILHAEEVIAHDPFAVLITNDLIDPLQEFPGVLSYLMSRYAEVGNNLLAVTAIPVELAPNHIMVAVNPSVEGLQKVENIMDKPAAIVAASNLAIVGRYIFQPEIFPLLKQSALKVEGEAVFIDALAELVHVEDCYAYKFSGQIHIKV